MEAQTVADNTCSSRDKSAIVAKDSDEIKSREARNYKLIIKRAILLKKKGKDSEEILTELLKKLSISSPRRRNG